MILSSIVKALGGDAKYIEEQKRAILAMQKKKENELFEDISDSEFDETPPRPIVRKKSIYNFKTSGAYQKHSQEEMSNLKAGNEKVLPIPRLDPEAELDSDEFIDSKNQ